MQSGGNCHIVTVPLLWGETISTFGGRFQWKLGIACPPGALGPAGTRIQEMPSVTFGRKHKPRQLFVAAATPTLFFVHVWHLVKCKFVCVCACRISALQ